MSDNLCFYLFFIVQFLYIPPKVPPYLFPPLKFGCYSYSISEGNALPSIRLLYDSAIPQ